MAKQLTIEHEGKTYTLEFSRSSVRALERRGFIVGDVGDKPMMILDMFAGAFSMHHSNVKREKIEEIYDSLGNKEKLIEALSEMYSEPIETLTAEPETGNATWTANW